MPVSIYQDGYLIYRTQLTLRYNTRIVLDFFTNYGLFLLDSYAVQGRIYGIDQWDDVWNTIYGKERAYGLCFRKTLNSKLLKVAAAVNTGFYKELLLYFFLSDNFKDTLIIGNIQN